MVGSTMFERLSIRRIDPHASRDRWAAALNDAAWLAKATVAKTEGHATVLLATLDGQDVVIKSRALERAADRLKSLFRRGRTDRQWRGARRLINAKIDAAKPILCATGYIRTPDGQRLPVEVIALHAADGPQLLDVIADTSMNTRMQHQLARDLGHMIAALIEKRIFNRDPKPSNIIIEHGRPTFIDTVAIRDYKGIDHTARMLASLYIEPLGCGAPPRRTLAMRTIKAVVGPDRNAQRQMWRRVERIIRNHGDPTPKTDPRAS